MDSHDTLAAIYVRVSSKEQAEGGHSLQGQREECEEYCKKQGYKIYKIYEDRGKSAGDDECLLDVMEYINKRPALKQLYEDAGKKLFNHLVVWKWDRHGRDSLGDKGLEYLNKRCGVTSESVTEGGDFIVRKVRGALSEDERRKLTQRIKLGQEQKVKKQGMPNHRPPFGYKEKKGIRRGKLKVISWIKDKKTYEIVPLLFEEYLQGKSYVSLAKKYDITTHKTVKNILTNKSYLGKFSFRGVWIDGKHEALIEVQLYEDVQKEIKKRERMRL